MSRSWSERSSPPSRRSRSPAAALPSRPVTRITSPAAPLSRRSASPGRTVPPTETSMTSGPSMALTSPPATTQPAEAAAAHSPRWISMMSSALVVAGAHRVAAHQAGLAPMPARSDRATASARIPSRCGVIHERRKSTPSTRASWLMATCVPGSGTQSAASSPVPSARLGDVARAISASALSSSPSPRSARVGPPMSKVRSGIRSASNVTRPQYTWPTSGVPLPRRPELHSLCPGR